MSLLADLLEQTPVPQVARIGVRSPGSHDSVRVSEPVADAKPPQVVEFSRARRNPSHTSPHSSAATATPEWRHARDGYINHLMTCRSCYAPTARYCRLGADLRATYETTPMEEQQ